MKASLPSLIQPNPLKEKVERVGKMLAEKGEHGSTFWEEYLRASKPRKLILLKSLPIWESTGGWQFAEAMTPDLLLEYLDDMMLATKRKTESGKLPRPPDKLK